MGPALRNYDRNNTGPRNNWTPLPPKVWKVREGGIILI